MRNLWTAQRVHFPAGGTLKKGRGRIFQFSFWIHRQSTPLPEQCAGSTHTASIQHLDYMEIVLTQNTIEDIMNVRRSRHKTSDTSTECMNAWLHEFPFQFECNLSNLWDLYLLKSKLCITLTKLVMHTAEYDCSRIYQNESALPRLDPAVPLGIFRRCNGCKYWSPCWK